MEAETIDEADLGEIQDLASELMDDLPDEHEWSSSDDDGAGENYGIIVLVLILT